MGHLQDLLVADSPAWGVWLNLGSAVSAEIASLAGYDWLLVDLEHGSGDSRDLSLQLWAAQAGESATIVRVASLNAAEIKRVLDMGPAGVMIPNVETLAQAQAAVAAVRIPPLGARGAATSTRSSRYGFGYEHYIQTANRDLQLVVQIESVIGVENAAAIACTPGIDALFVGPLDLSVSMGITDPDRDARFASALEKVVRSSSSRKNFGDSGALGGSGEALSRPWLPATRHGIGPGDAGLGHAARHRRTALAAHGG